MRVSGHHLLSLLDNVLDMASLTAGGIQVVAEPVRLAHVVHEAVDMLVPACAARLQTLRSEGADDVVVSGDHARLRQVLVNLIGNAAKFTPPNGAITVSISRLDALGQGEIRVTDTGPGIAHDEQAAVFEPYYRSAGSVRLPGIGLGLAISHALITQMGGTLSVESELGKGAAFIVRLPLQ